MLEDRGDVDAALRRYDAAVACAPTMPRAHLNRGNALLIGGNAAGAVQAYAHALEHQAGYAPAYYGMGNALSSLRRLRDASTAYRRALELKPDFADAAVALGNVQEDLLELDASAASFRHALTLAPGYAQVYYNLSNVERRLGQLDAAEASCRRALQLQPGLAEASNNLGVVLLAQKRLPEALAAFGEAVACSPSFGAALVQRYRCAGRLCDWRDRASDERRLAALVAEGAPDIAPFALTTMDEPKGEPAALLQREAGLRFAGHKWAALMERGRSTETRRERAARLRIGYLSADFHEHATMHLLRGVLSAHDRQRFSIHGYSYGDVRDAMSERARQACDGWQDLQRLSDEDAAAAIAADGIDILVDLKGYTQETRMEIVALRPAPVIASWLGYPATLGHPALADYVVSDSVVTPLGHVRHFSETLALLPHCYQPNDREKAIGPRPSRAAACLPERAFVFCTFNDCSKFSPSMFGAWCALLREVHGSVLWLLEPDPVAIENLRREAAEREIDAARLVFAPRQPLEEHLGRLQLADLALDTFPYGSHTTGSDVLWAGVPLVTLQGMTFASRVASSLLSAVGLPELVTHNIDEYVALASALALDPARLARLRARLVERRLTASLFDTQRFTRNLERLYLRMWEQHAEGRREPIVLED